MLAAFARALLVSHIPDANAQAGTKELSQTYTATKGALPRSGGKLGGKSAADAAAAGQTDQDSPTSNSWRADADLSSDLSSGLCAASAARARKMSEARIRNSVSQPHHFPWSAWSWIAINAHANVSVTWIPKVMCTSIRDSTNMEWKEAHLSCSKRRQCALARMNPALQKRNLSTYVRVVVLRDPMARALSAYHNSASNLMIYVPGCTSTRERVHNCTFEQWMVAVTSISRSLVVPDHWRGWGPLRIEHFLPQAEIAQVDTMHYHHVLLMDEVTDIACLWGMLGTRPIHSNAGALGKGTKGLAVCDRPSHIHAAPEVCSSEKGEPSPRAKHLVRTLYAKDYDLLARGA